MLANLLKAFVGANIVSTGASYLLGAENPISTNINKITSGSFLGIGDSATSGGSTTGLSTTNKTDVSKFTTSISTGASSAPQLRTDGGANNRFPIGSNNTIKTALADYRIQRLLQDASINTIGNKTIQLDDYKDYDVTEKKIDVRKA